MNRAVLVFDVESVGLFGEGFAVAGGILVAGEFEQEFCFSCPPYLASGGRDGREWVACNVPELEVTHSNPTELRDAFWEFWQSAKQRHADLLVAADCNWPVEANFLIDCVHQDAHRTWQAPYPFVDIASILLAAGMDPLGEYERTETELPKHHPLMDARQSARLLTIAWSKLRC